MGRYYQPTTTTTTTSAKTCDFGTPGSYTWTVPTGITKASFEIWGAGGGGGAVACCSCYYAGPPGAGGGFSKKAIAVTPGQAYTICVGYGGMVSTVGSCQLHSCCCGAAGTTTYVTGTNLSNFCATGGDGGQAQCYWGCGCSNTGGQGYGGDINQPGGAGGGGHASSQCMLYTGMAGAAAFTGGSGIFTSDACFPSCMPGQVGQFPGGGGTTAFANQCCCCGPGGTGGNGLVRIYY